jgi:hypothetical protein
MAAGAIVRNTWRFVFGDTEDWMPPQVQCLPTAHDAQSQTSWRFIFGNNSAWLPPQLDNAVSMPANRASERCELCRQPIADGESFMTNSAGERPTHTRCLGAASTAITEARPQSASWRSRLCGLVRH